MIDPTKTRAIKEKVIPRNEGAFKLPRALPQDSTKSPSEVSTDFIDPLSRYPLRDKRYSSLNRPESQVSPMEKISDQEQIPNKNDSNEVSSTGNAGFPFLSTQQNIKNTYKRRNTIHFPASRSSQEAELSSVSNSPVGTSGKRTRSTETSSFEGIAQSHPKRIRRHHKSELITPSIKEHKFINPFEKFQLSE
jgi:hypothetical protein